MSRNTLVLYHAACADGFTAAWLAHKKFPDAEFVPVQYGQAPPAVANRDVYVLDFSYPADQLQHMISMSRVFTLLDHHKTAKDALETLAAKHKSDERVKIHFDMAKSGARLTWEHFNTKTPNNPPLLVKYVEDRDLWLWNLPYSREVSAWVASYPKTFEDWDRIHAFLDVGPENAGSEGIVLKMAAEQGEAILRYQARVVENHVKNAVEVDIGGHQVLCCNCTSLISEVGEALGANKVFGATYFIDKEGKKVYSLRSRPPHGIDVSKIAKAKGGGGHAGAAGFRE